MDATQKKAEAAKIREDGYTLHGRSSDCNEGCGLCKHFREVIDWPSGIPLETNLAQLGKEKLETLVQHYNIPLQSAGRVPFSSSSPAMI